MTSITALLLQAAISLLLFVQANPHLDSSLREQAIAIANQAIKTATQQTTVPQPQTPSHTYEKPVSSSSQKPVITSVNGKGGFGTGDSNYILGENFATVTDVWLQNNKRVETALGWGFDSDTRINVSVPNSLPKDTYYLYVKNKAGTSVPYWVGTIGTSETSVPSITVTSPNGGEKWRPGEVHRITWTSANVENVVIYLYDSNISGSGSTNYITKNNLSVSATQGYYDWTIPAQPLNNVAGGNNFRIRIDNADATDLSHSDSSDAPFSIYDIYLDD